MEARTTGAPSSVIQRLTVLHYFVENRPTVQELCGRFGISRSTFHRWVDRFDDADPSSILIRAQDSHASHHSMVAPQVTELIRSFRLQEPLLGKERIAVLLRENHGIELSSSTVGRVIDRECLYFADTPLHWKKRMEHEQNSPKHAATPSVSHPVIPEQAQAPVFPQSAVAPVANFPMSKDPPSPQWELSGLMKPVVVASVLTNIVFVSMLIGMALFERSTRQVQAVAAGSHPGVQIDGEPLHGAAQPIILPQ